MSGQAIEHAVSPASITWRMVAVCGRPRKLAVYCRFSMHRNLPADTGASANEGVCRGSTALVSFWS